MKKRNAGGKDMNDKKLTKEQIADLFIRGQDCGQVFFERYAGRYGFSAKDANLMTACFGGGNGIGETCGAVLGAMMVIGLEYGHKGADDMEQKEILMAKRAEFMQKWKAKRGSSLCNDLLGHDIGTPEGFAKVIEEGLLTDLCPLIVLDAMEVLDGMLR